MKISISLLILTWASLGWSWAEHHIITKTALKGLPYLRKTVTYTTPSALFLDLGFSDQRHFNESIQIRKDFVFSNKLGEASQPAGKGIRALDILSVYSDEPDWEMDTELFDSDQYPELWKPEYSMMGGKKGTSSQAFRHMHWQEFSFWHPLATFKLPPDQFFHSMGLAPERAQVFLGLSHLAFQRGHPYWGFRFLACALHYLEDVSSPFHSTQTPTKKFLTLPFVSQFGQGAREYVTQVTHVISYYHFAFEDFIGEMAKVYDQGEPDSSIRALFDKLKTPTLLSTTEPFQFLEKQSLLQAASMARTSLDFFPAITHDFVTLDAKAFMDDQWWKEVKKRAQHNSREKLEFYRGVGEIFENLGEALRQLVVENTSRP